MSKKFDLDAMSVADLKALKLQIDEAMAKSLSREQEEAAAEIRRIAESVGLSVRALAKMGGQKRDKTKLATPLPKFRHPGDPAITWSGRGAVPGWIKNYESSGKSRSDLLIAR